MSLIAFRNCQSAVDGTSAGAAAAAVLVGAGATVTVVGSAAVTVTAGAGGAASGTLVVGCAFGSTGFGDPEPKSVVARKISAPAIATTRVTSPAEMSRPRGGA